MARATAPVFQMVEDLQGRPTRQAFVPQPGQQTLGPDTLLDKKALIEAIVKEDGTIADLLQEVRELRAQRRSDNYALAARVEFLEELMFKDTADEDEEAEKQRHHEGLSAQMRDFASDAQACSPQRLTDEEKVEFTDGQGDKVAFVYRHGKLDFYRKGALDVHVSGWIDQNVVGLLFSGIDSKGKRCQRSVAVPPGLGEEANHAVHLSHKAEAEADATRKAKALEELDAAQRAMGQAAFRAGAKNKPALVATRQDNLSSQFTDWFPGRPDPHSMDRGMPVNEYIDLHTMGTFSAAYTKAHPGAGDNEYISRNRLRELCGEQKGKTVNLWIHDHWASHHDFHERAHKAGHAADAAGAGKVPWPVYDSFASTCSKVFPA